MISHITERSSVGLSAPAVLSPHFPSVRLGRLEQLTERRLNEITACADLHTVWRELNGSSVTSREKDFGMSGSLKVGMVSGDIIARELPWLMELYRTTFLDVVNSLGLGRYVTAPNDRSSININSIEPDGRYEWHVDSNPLTLLMFITTHQPGSGGELLFQPDPRTDPQARWQHVLHPVAGEAFVFDARKAAHTVLPVGAAARRISVPMNYYLAGETISRPADLDAYLYE